MWDETKARCSGNEMVSAILKWANQNKDMAVIMCLFYILHKNPQRKCINYKFLLRRHMHMEAKKDRFFTDADTQGIGNISSLVFKKIHCMRYRIK